MRLIFTASMAVLSLSHGIVVWADDNVPLRELITCTEIDGLTKVIKKLDGVDASKRQIVDSQFTAELLPKDGGVMPERFFLKDQSREIDFTLKEDGQIPDFEQVRQAGEGAKLCTEDPTRVGQARDGEDMSFSMNFGVFFKETNGIHSLESLKKGTKDGRSFYKKLAPGPAAMLVPKFKYVTLTYEDEATEPQVSAARDGEPVKGLVIEPFYEQFVVSLEQLELIGADTLVIEGGPYRLSPSPSPKKMESFRKQD